MRRESLLVVLSLAVFTSAAKLPTYFTPRCSRSLNEVELGDCSMKLANKGLPILANGDKKLRIPSMRPLLVPKMSLAQGTAQVGLNLTWEPAEMWGLGESRLTDIKMNFEKKTASYDLVVPQFTLTGPYKSHGRVLLLPITGSGPSNFTVQNLRIHYKYEWPLKKGTDGKQYCVIQNPSIEVKGADGMVMQFDGLFNGDKLLGNQMNLFLNENWRELLRELGPGMAEATGKVVQLVMQSLADHVSIDDMFDP